MAGRRKREVPTAQLEALRKALVAASKKAFAGFRRKHPEERFYAFVLYTEPLMGYVYPSANTEEGLRAVCGPRFGDAELRWNPEDWPYHTEQDDSFEGPQKSLLGVQKWAAGDEPREDAAREAIFEVFHLVLEDLDRDGLFGAGEGRDAILLNVLWGDQDLPVHLASAERLNPRRSFLRYARHELAGLRSHVQEFRVPEHKKLLARLEAELKRTKLD